MTAGNLSFPQDNIRFPEAISIKYGPARILSRLFIAADNMARALGVDLKFRNDFEALLDFNRGETEKGTWYKMHAVFDCSVSRDLGPKDAFWIAAESPSGEIVATQCGRVFHWEGRSLADEIRLMYYGGRDVGQTCIVTSKLAESITGSVYYAGGGWVAPAYRGSGLISLLPHLARAYAVSRWPVDYAMSLIQIRNLNRMKPYKLGYTEYDYGVRFPGYPNGDIDAMVCRLTAEEIYADFNRFASDWREYIRVKPQAA